MKPISFSATILLLVALVSPTYGADGDWPPKAMTKEPRILATHVLRASLGMAERS